MQIKLYIPNKIYKSIYDIDYYSLKNMNKDILLFDVDNTLMSYLENNPSDKLIDLFNKLNDLGFKTLLISNNNKTRVGNIKKVLNCFDAFYKLNKPCVYKLNKLIKQKEFDLNNIVLIGDQMLTDIYCGNKIGVFSILVKSIDRSSEHWYTTINRKREKRIINKIKDIDNNIYQQIVDLYK